MALHADVMQAEWFAIITLTIYFAVLSLGLVSLWQRNRQVSLLPMESDQME
jgi:hypothetical protein